MNPCIIYVMGVSGSGKTTVGEKLSERINMPFFDGDDFHTEANKEKMRAGHPLTDEDRAGWLNRLNELAKEQMTKKGAIIGCSALKKKYRKVLSRDITSHLFWVFLNGSYELIKKRMERRKGHFMPASMLSSQFKALEPPTHAITIDISKTPDEIVDEIIGKLNKASSKNST
jgi:carbohydrate kinase (thermoresistant glucokinase family)